MRYGELKNQTGTQGPRSLLWCEECGTEYSADAGDYFWADKSAEIRCECGALMLQVLKTTTLHKVS